jgi:hypothetical protein
MNMIYGITKINVDKAFYAKNVDHDNFKDQKENNDYKVMQATMVYFKQM